MILLDICNESMYLKPIYILLTALNIVFVVVPIILFVLTVIETFKSITNPENQKEGLTITFKRLIAAFCIFLTPTAINYAMSLTNNELDLKTCLLNANKNYIESLERMEEDEREAQRIRGTNVYNKEEKERAENAKHESSKTNNESNQSNNQTSHTAKEFLNTLNKMSNQVEKDYKAGHPWTYKWNSGKGKYQGTFDIANNTNKEAVCVCIASWALIDMGVLEPGDMLNKRYSGSESKTTFFNQFGTSSSSDVQKRATANLTYIDGNGVTASSLIKSGKLIAGDIIYWDYEHVSVYAGDGMWYDSGRGNPKNIKAYTFTTWGPVKMSANSKVFKIARLK